MDARAPNLRLVRPAPPPVPAGASAADDVVDTSDVDALFRRFAPYVARIGIRLLGRRDDVDDLVQDVFLDATRGLDRLREPAAVRGWLATVTVRHARRRLRKRRVLAAFGLEAPVDPSTLLDAGASPEQHAHAAAVFRVLDAVSADARIAWMLIAVEGESLEHVAEVCGCSRATAHRRLQEARNALAEVFDHG